MVKTDAINIRGVQLSGMNSTCMDCIFWYQCRRGEIDCHLKAQRSSSNAVKA